MLDHTILCMHCIFAGTVSIHSCGHFQTQWRCGIMKRATRKCTPKLPLWFHRRGIIKQHTIVLAAFQKWTSAHIYMLDCIRSKPGARSVRLQPCISSFIYSSLTLSHYHSFCPSVWVSPQNKPVASLPHLYAPAQRVCYTCTQRWKMLWIESRRKMVAQCQRRLYLQRQKQRGAIERLWRGRIWALCVVFVCLWLIDLWANADIILLVCCVNVGDATSSPVGCTYGCEICGRCAKVWFLATSLAHRLRALVVGSFGIEWIMVMVPALPKTAD